MINHLFLPLSITLLSAACATSPASQGAETFGLVDVGGQSLPVGYPEEDGCREEILSATLALESGGKWRMRLSKREICGAEIEADEDVEEGRFTRAGATYRFTGPEPSVGSAGEIEIESLTEGSLDGEVLRARLSDGTAVVFRRSSTAE